MPDDSAALPGKPAPWYRRYRSWAALAVLVALVALAASRFHAAPQFGPPLVRLMTKDGTLSVALHVSADGRAMALRASNAAAAGANQSYQLWLIPAIGKPLSLAVLDRLDTELSFPADQRDRLRNGAALAISTEPAGGSTTGQPSGTVILAATIGD